MTARAIAHTGQTLADLLAEVEGQVGPMLRAMDWAEAEIAAASRRHPAAADLLYHAFVLIGQDAHRFPVEFVYRGHVRELLDRLAVGGDLRPATAAEVCLVCAKTSQLAPFHASGVGLYMRMWAQAFPDHPVYDGQAEDLGHYEALRDGQIDDLEAAVRRRAAQAGRVLQVDGCQGRHHGVAVQCRFALPAAPTGPVALFELEGVGS